MTIYLVVTAAVSGHPQWQSIGLLASILGLPGILILVTTRKLIYIGWMISKQIASTHPPRIFSALAF
jgi:chitin synthase